MFVLQLRSGAQTPMQRCAVRDNRKLCAFAANLGFAERNFVMLAGVGRFGENLVVEIFRFQEKGKATAAQTMTQEPRRVICKSWCDNANPWQGGEDGFKVLRVIQTTVNVAARRKARHDVGRPLPVGAI